MVTMYYNNKTVAIHDDNYRIIDTNFDHSVVQAQGKPTQAARGVHEGFSLPIYDDDDEELFTCFCMPTDWDGVTSPVFYLGCWLDTANNDKEFNLQVSVNCIASGAVVSTSTTDIPVETNTGNASQYQFFIIPFTWDAAGGGCAAGNALGVRIRRLAVAVGSSEITGEIVVKGLGMKYRINSVGGSS